MKTRTDYIRAAAANLQRAENTGENYRERTMHGVLALANAALAYLTPPDDTTPPDKPTAGFKIGDKVRHAGQTTHTGEVVDLDANARGVLVYWPDTGMSTWNHADAIEHA